MSSDDDGWRRNVKKLRAEWRASEIGMQPHWQRFRSGPDVHAYVNLFVESRRISPYLWGHVDSVLYPVVIGTAIWIGWR